MAGFLRFSNRITLLDRRDLSNWIDSNDAREIWNEFLPSFYWVFPLFKKMKFTLVLLVFIRGFYLVVPSVFFFSFSEFGAWFYRVFLPSFCWGGALLGFADGTRGRGVIHGD